MRECKCPLCDVKFVSNDAVWSGRTLWPTWQLVRHMTHTHFVLPEEERARSASVNYQCVCGHRCCCWQDMVGHLLYRGRDVETHVTDAMLDNIAGVSDDA